jgi:alkylhydroperoxidase family enzyme
MARVPYIDKDDLPPEFRDRLNSSANIVRALSHSPNVALQSGAAAQYIRKDNLLDPRLREMAIIQVGYTARSAYEYAHHIEYGFEYGVSAADVRAIADETAGRSSRRPRPCCAPRAR